MDKETLSNYGWVVICVLVVMIALAIDKCNTYESLLKLAGNVVIQHEGKNITLLKYLTDLQESIQEQHRTIDDILDH
ncbi:MAG: hypothetical protein E7558_03445 [Ruminococcaceae bacterium]|nr:hypothetical protein [Oscillospiraceae bacterium]